MYLYEINGNRSVFIDIVNIISCNLYYFYYILFNFKRIKRKKVKIVGKIILVDVGGCEGEAHRLLVCLQCGGEGLGPS